MALQVGIVGLPNAGKTSLFRALTGAETTGRDNVGMAAVPDDRLRQLAETVGAKKVTPRRSASSTSREPARSCSGTCARST